LLYVQKLDHEVGSHTIKEALSGAVSHAKSGPSDWEEECFYERVAF